MRITATREILKIKKHKKKVDTKQNDITVTASQQAVSFARVADIPTPEPSLAPALPFQWQVVAESSVGMAHRRMTPAVPCQDASLAVNSTRTILIVCDGAGSAKLSHIGSTTLVQSLHRLLFAIEGMLIRFLDGGDDTAYSKNLAEMIYRYAIHQMIDLGQSHQRSDKDFRSTLLLAVVGQAQTFWLKVGDGELVYEDRSAGLSPLGQRGKEEFANQTTFVDASLSFASVQYGALPSADITGLAVMSDGASERLVATDGQQVAAKVSEFLQALRTEKLGREKLFHFFNDAQNWEGSTHDDKSLALAAR